MQRSYLNCSDFWQQSYLQAALSRFPWSQVTYRIGPFHLISAPSPLLMRNFYFTHSGNFSSYLYRKEIWKCRPIFPSQKLQLFSGDQRHRLRWPFRNQLSKTPPSAPKIPVPQKGGGWVRILNRMAHSRISVLPYQWTRHLFFRVKGLRFSSWELEDFLPNMTRPVTL